MDNRVCILIYRQCQGVERGGWLLRHAFGECESRPWDLCCTDEERQRVFLRVFGQYL